jgi:acyl-[acyl-carrier-protein]-phospholipid O-acyltransferase/long-chain-fatty-acid--[acyl-carrier-protein] ligase
MAFQPAETLRSRTYLGLLASQFLAAFNDQAIHIVAIFYAGDMLIHYARVPHVHENTVIALVTACFILPFFLFSTLAGMLADRYSKRNILVLWKVAEVAIMAIALVGFILPHTHVLGWAPPRTLAIWSAALVVSTVFLMGTHSAFFVPAKYGVMPEILEHSVLSKGNGYLEATSFLAQIFGTVFGAWLYGRVKSVQEGVLTSGHEWLLGSILFGLALLGAACSLIIERMPAAAPNQPLTWKLWQPLGRNVGTMLRSRPLVLSVIGIAFFLCLTLYARQTLLYDGEATRDYNEAKLQEAKARDAARHKPRVARPDPEDDEDGAPDQENPDDISTSIHPSASKPQTAELRVAVLIALVGLGVGIGSPLAGLLSGDKIELGLVPIGSFFLILFTVVLAFVTQRPLWTVVCLISIGVAAGFYIVPLYTLLQHRAPKDSKGNLVATSNFINVVGGLLAIGVFWLLTTVLEKVTGIGPNPDREQLETKMGLTKILFLALGLMTAGMLFLLCQQLPDFFTRTLLWLRSLTRYRLHVIGLNNLPSDGPVILATNCETPESCMKVLTATDRFTRFILVEHSPEARLPWVLRYLARRTHLAVLHPGHVSGEVLSKTLADAVQVLRRGEMVGLPANGNGHGVSFDVDLFLAKLRAQIPQAQVLPVWCGADNGAPSGGKRPVRQRVRVVIGRPVPADTPADEIRHQIHALAQAPDHSVAGHELAQGLQGLQPHGG